LKAKQSTSEELEINDKTGFKAKYKRIAENESKTMHKWGIADKRQKSHKCGTKRNNNRSKSKISHFIYKMIAKSGIKHMKRRINAEQKKWQTEIEDFFLYIYIKIKTWK